jgi:hypothetical protein
LYRSVDPSKSSKAATCFAHRIESLRARRESGGFWVPSHAQAHIILTRLSECNIRDQFARALSSLDSKFGCMALELDVRIELAEYPYLI